MIALAARILVAQNVAIPISSLCINRRLYQIASVKSAAVTRAEKRRAIIVDLVIGIGIPILSLVFREAKSTSLLCHFPSK